MSIVVNSILMVAMVYLLAGALFTLFFLSTGLEKIDTTAHGSGWGFRLIIIPGTIVLWPVLLKKWMRIKKKRHDETTS
jgi:hypothetical protein